MEDSVAMGALEAFVDFVKMGGPAMWVIAMLSLMTLALIIWKILRFLSFGAWSGRARVEKALAYLREGNPKAAIDKLRSSKSFRARLALKAMELKHDPNYDQSKAEVEITRVARGYLSDAKSGLRGLELASTIGPLLGLLGTITGMIAAFQALQEAGNRADPASLAGGIWEALLTTAAGMAVAIPAQIALTWFDSVIDNLQHDMEDSATQIINSDAANVDQGDA